MSESSTTRPLQALSSPFRLAARPALRVISSERPPTSALDRVEEVVNYGRANNMYVIVNVHHDDPWIIPTYDKGDEVKDRLSKLWTQHWLIQKLM